MLNVENDRIAAADGAIAEMLKCGCSLIMQRLGVLFDLWVKTASVHDK